MGAVYRIVTPYFSAIAQMRSRRRVGRAFVHHRRGAVGQRAVHDVAVAGDPADVGRAPVHVVVGVEIEHVLVGERDLREVAAGRVHDALRLRGRARRVQQVQQVFAVHVLGRTLRICRGDQVGVPMVATVDHVDRLIDALDDDHVLDRRRVGQRRIDVRLQHRRRAAPEPTVGRDHDLALGVVDAVDQRVRAEATEHDGVRRTDAGARQHRHRQLGDHRHVDGDAVALLHAERLQRVGELLHLGEQVGIRDRARVAGLAFPVVGDLVAAPPRRAGRGSCTTR